MYHRPPFCGGRGYQVDKNTDKMKSQTPQVLKADRLGFMHSVTDEESKVGATFALIVDDVLVAFCRIWH